MPCVQYGVLAEHLRTELQPLGSGFWPNALAFGCLDLMACLLHISLWPGISLVPVSALLHWKLRSKIRAKYGIEVSGWLLLQDGT